MSKASEAFTRAERDIAKAAKSGKAELDFDKPAYRDLTEIPAQIATLTGLQTLGLNSTQITDLAPLAGLTGLANLWLNNTQITDLAPLAGLTGLKSLGLNNTQITDLAPLAGLTGLQSLRLDSTQITDLAPLAGLTGLQILDLDNTQITDLAPLAGMTGLATLYLNSTQITDLAPLAGLAGLATLWLEGTQITDLAPLAGLTGLQRLWLDSTQITNLTPLAGMTGLATLWLNNTQITDLAPLAGLTGLQTLRLDSTQITNLAPLAGVTGLQDLSLDDTSVLDMRPIAGLDKLGTDEFSLFRFSNTPATARDARLAELADIKDTADRARQTLAYLRSLPPPPLPYTPAATPDGSPPQPIGDDIAVQAQQLADALPLAEDIIQNPETGAFDVRPRPAVKPDLYAVDLEQVADAVADVLRDPRNGLNADSPVIFRLKRTLERYANDPQRVEKDFTNAHASLTYQMAVGDLPASDENQHLQRVTLEGAQGIRATHPDIAANRRLQQDQALRELTPKDIATIANAAPVLEALTEGDLQAQMAEDIAVLAPPPNYPRLMGVTRADSILGYDEAARVLGRSARIMIKVQAWRANLGKLTDKVRESPEFKAYEIIYKLSPLIMLGVSLLIFVSG